MSDLGAYNIKGTATDSAEYHALLRVGMSLEPHADGKGFMLTIPRNKFFVADADPLPGLSGKMRSIHEQRTGNPMRDSMKPRRLTSPRSRNGGQLPSSQPF